MADFIDTNRVQYGLGPICTLLTDEPGSTFYVAPGGYDKYPGRLEADAQAWERARRRKLRCRLVRNRKLCELVEEKLREDYGVLNRLRVWLKRELNRENDRRLLQVSHVERFMREMGLFIQAWFGALKKALTQRSADQAALRFADPNRPHGKASVRKGQIELCIADITSVATCPASVEDRMPFIDVFTGKIV